MDIMPHKSISSTINFSKKNKKITGKKKLKYALLFYYKLLKTTLDEWVLGGEGE